MKLHSTLLTLTLMFSMAPISGASPADPRGKELADFANQIIVDNIWACASEASSDKNCEPFVYKPYGQNNLTDDGYFRINSKLSELSMYLALKDPNIIVPTALKGQSPEMISLRASRLQTEVTLRKISEAIAHDNARNLVTEATEKK